MRKIFAISLAVLMLALSLKAGVAVHLCGGKLVQSKFVIGYGKASCGMEEQNNQCENSSASLNKKSCCVNGLQQITSDDYQISGKLAHSFFDYTFTSFQFIVVSYYLPTEVNHSIQYRPPPGLSSVFLPFLQIFLI